MSIAQRIEHLPDWLYLVIGLLVIFVFVAWILFPIMVMIGLDRIRKVLIDIRDGKHGLDQKAPPSVFTDSPSRHTTPRNLYGRSKEH